MAASVTCCTGSPWWVQRELKASKVPSVGWVTTKAPVMMPEPTGTSATATVVPPPDPPPVCPPLVWPPVVGVPPAAQPPRQRASAPAPVAASSARREAVSSVTVTIVSFGRSSKA